MSDGIQINGTETNNYRQFHVLDEITNDSDSNNSQSSDSDIPDEEIDKLLEDALKNKKKRSAGEAGLGRCLFEIFLEAIELGLFYF